MDAVKAGPSEAEELAGLLLEDADDEVEEAYYLAPPLVLTWRKFRKHNLAVNSAAVLLILYLLVLFAEFISPHSPHERYVEYAQAPLQRLRFIDSEGKFHLQPFVYGTEQKMDDKFMRTYPPVTDQIYPVRLFVRGAPYKMWNFLRTDVHLFGAGPEAPLFLLGTDGDGRDLLSRLIFGTVSPSQPMPPLGSPTRAATEHLATLYAEYDPELANSLLDEIGLDQRNADGWRLRPDGEELLVNFVHYGWTDDTELVVDHLQQVGIHATNNFIDSRLFWERMRAVDWDALTIGGTPTHPYILTARRGFVPDKSAGPYPLFGLYLETNGEEGLELTGGPLQNQERWLALQSETDPEKQLQLVVDIVTTAREELWNIGTTTMSPIVGVVDPSIKNLPDEMFLGWDNTMADVYRPETMFFDR